MSGKGFMTVWKWNGKLPKANTCINVFIYLS